MSKRKGSRKDLIQRVFVGRARPALWEAARLLRERYGVGAVWDMGRVLVAVPGSQAKRRLRRLLHDEAALNGVRALTQPKFVTPGELLEKLYQPPCKIADPVSVHFAWVQAVREAGREDKAAFAPEADPAQGSMGWAGMAREAQRARTAAAGEGLTLQTIAGKCAELPDVCGDKRWPALARLEYAYLAQLDAAGLCDRDQARMEALAAGLSCDRDITLVGLQDLNGLDRAMLSALASPVVAVIPAPEEEQERFDAAGCLRTECREHADLQIPDEVLWFVAGPAEEADALVGDIAGLDGAFPREEITIGIGDESAAESLARRLAVSGIPSYSPFGRLLPSSRPAALLSAVQEYLQAPTARTFAALARHPDLEAWLTARRDEVDPAEDALPLLTQMDIYRAECHPETLPAGEDARKLLESPCPSRAKLARAGVLAAHDAADRLIAPLRGAVRPLSGWAEPVLALLRAVYAGMPLAGDAEGRQFSRALAGLTGILQEMQDLPLTLSPAVSGLEALAFVLGQAQAQRLPLEPGSEAGGGVEMMGWLELALDDAPVLLLTGLQEGCVPAGSGDDPLLPDSLRQTLGLACDRRRQARDGLLLRQMIESRQSEGRHVRLLVSRQSADGTPRLPSRLLFACPPEEAARRAKRFADRPPNAAPAPALFAAGPKRALAPPPPAVPALPLAEMSVSAFGDYLACPYRFYLRHVLKLGEQEDAQREMAPHLFGVLIHDCLSAFAQSEAAEFSDPRKIQPYFKDELAAQSRKRFGANPSPAIQMQIRQVGRRLKAFSVWQAQSVKEGWVVQSDLSEKELTASFEVDGESFIFRGRLDRVDFHAQTGSYRILDYKSGDAGAGPEETHRKSDGTGSSEWTDLQLPLYRLLLAANRVDPAQIAPGALGYVLLSADLTPVICLDTKKRSGGTGFVSVSWTDADHDSAGECAAEIIRNIRAGKFWPPTDPSPFPPSRLDPGRSESYGGLCLDACADRREWFRTATEEHR